MGSFAKGSASFPMGAKMVTLFGYSFDPILLLVIFSCIAAIIIRICAFLFPGWLEEHGDPPEEIL